MLLKYIRYGIYLDCLRAYSLVIASFLFDFNTKDAFLILPIFVFLYILLGCDIFSQNTISVFTVCIHLVIDKAVYSGSPRIDHPSKMITPL